VRPPCACTTRAGSSGEPKVEPGKGGFLSPLAIGPDVHYRLKKCGIEKAATTNCCFWPRTLEARLHIMGDRLSLYIMRLRCPCLLAIVDLSCGGVSWSLAPQGQRDCLLASTRHSTSRHLDNHRRTRPLRSAPSLSAMLPQLSDLPFGLPLSLSH
jgi:hypothetical protein